MFVIMAVFVVIVVVLLFCLISKWHLSAAGADAIQIPSPLLLTLFPASLSFCWTSPNCRRLLQALPLFNEPLHQLQQASSISSSELFGAVLETPLDFFKYLWLPAYFSWIWNGILTLNLFRAIFCHQVDHDSDADGVGFEILPPTFISSHFSAPPARLRPTLHFNGRNISQYYSKGVSIRNSLSLFLVDFFLIFLFGFFGKYFV